MPWKATIRESTEITQNVIHGHGPAFGFYVLRNGESLYLIDGGFVGGPHFLRKALEKRGWDKFPIRGIVVTHGHLDHVLNIAALAKESGAWIAAHRLDAAHYEGRYPCRGASRICGMLEAMGRFLLNYKPFQASHWLDEGGASSNLGRLKCYRLARAYGGPYRPLQSKSQTALLCRSLCELRQAEAFTTGDFQ